MPTLQKGNLPDAPLRREAVDSLVLIVKNMGNPGNLFT